MKNPKINEHEKFEVAQNLYGGNLRYLLKQFDSRDAALTAIKEIDPKAVVIFYDHVNQKVPVQVIQANGKWRDTCYSAKSFQSPAHPYGAVHDLNATFIIGPAGRLQQGIEERRERLGVKLAELQKQVSEINSELQEMSEAESQLFYRLTIPVTARDSDVMAAHSEFEHQNPGKTPHVVFVDERGEEVKSDPFPDEYALPPESEQAATGLLP